MAKLDDTNTNSAQLHPDKMFVPVIDHVDTKDVRGNIITSFVLSHSSIPSLFDSHYVAYIGVDPGQRNMGLTIILPDRVTCFEIKLKRVDSSYERISNIRYAMIVCLASYKFARLCENSLSKVEGASYGEKFGQIQLSEARFSSILTLGDLRSSVSTIPPSTARKLVFGNGKIRAEDVWKDISPDAASSLCIAMAAQIGESNRHVLKA